ncbi:neurotoxin 3FTx-RI-like [Triplophysa dalaica]|uniref:neurotoxin 3FTx-RI-like n=1 Tax=Triplophysa dalaica TaxID=1582913 RepID=UPI0024DFF140|nr:neurotoxin 3FTx-RI-like [Triplophysa dalaica]
MDLRITIALLFTLITGGYSLKCYMCTSVLSSPCNTTETCAAGFSKCSTATVTTPQGSSTNKSCSTPDWCVNATAQPNSTIRCCDTDFCNSTDGVYKASFLLLLCPLFFYFLYH